MVGPYIDMKAVERPASVLVLDEATSALDNVTGRAVMEALQSLGH